MMSLRAVLWRSNLLVAVGIASSRRAGALLAKLAPHASAGVTCNEMKSLDEESAVILKAIKGML
jgi:hypothetical protein